MSRYVLEILNDSQVMAENQHLADEIGMTPVLTLNQQMHRAVSLIQEDVQKSIDINGGNLGDKIVVETNVKYIKQGGED